MEERRCCLLATMILGQLSWLLLAGPGMCGTAAGGQGCIVLWPGLCRCLGSEQWVSLPTSWAGPGLVGQADETQPASLAQASPHSAALRCPRTGGGGLEDGKVSTTHIACDFCWPREKEVAVWDEQAEGSSSPGEAGRMPAHPPTRRGKKPVSQSVLQSPGRLEEMVGGWAPWTPK